MNQQAIATAVTYSRARRRARMWRDVLTRRLVAVGGVAVIAAIALIFLFLASVALPLFLPASAQVLARYPLPAPQAGTTLGLVVEEQGEMAVRYTDRGEAVYFRAENGALLRRETLPLPAGARVTALATGDPLGGVRALGLSDGSVLVLRQDYATSYPGDRRVITPVIEYPVGRAPVTVAPGQPLTELAVQSDENATTLVARGADGRVHVVQLTPPRGLLAQPGRSERRMTTLADVPVKPAYLLLDRLQRNAYLVGRDGQLAYYDLTNPVAPRLVERLQAVPGGKGVEAASFLAGSISVLIAGSDGRVRQFFPVRDSDNRYALKQARVFGGAGVAITALAPEQRRKGFAAADARGVVSIYHSTAQRLLLRTQVGAAGLRTLTLAPRANRLLAEEAGGQVYYVAVHNRYPEVSWSALWGKVWYEGYGRPEWLWQSSAATSDFEPKFSLTPLAFGTLKGALYAMLFAVPLALLGAIYTGYFMTARLRGYVKPAIEVMAALPTVILGFLAGLWLAPFVESHLPGVLALLVVLPLGILGVSLGWHALPEGVRRRVPEGWEAALLLPVVLALGWLALALSGPFEARFLGGDAPHFLTTRLGIPYDQRNALVVGVAMGVAVIPNIFSIAEDAIFSVPRQLTQGSLALGATPWQTLARVVLLTASPGIFSAVMIGLGRAVGETMIVLMATGNTPLMDLSPFQGMRTLAANVAVEMPESEVGSTHYRVLVLAALVLFLFTFAVNTLAEVVRQRLRERYSSL